MKNPQVEVNHARELALAQGMARPITQSGAVSRYLEPAGNGLHHVFFLRVGGRDWVGRKVLQRDEHNQWHLSSVLKPSMLFGLHVESQWGNEGVSIYFQTATPADKVAAFDAARMRPDSEVRFPFTQTDDSGQEAVCPVDYWQGSESLATQLNADEVHFREHCVELLKALSKPGTLIYDPACSTGAFIAHLARELPDCRCAGSDRSASMIEYAKSCHASSSVEFCVMDACEVVDSGIQCDVLILRFLNAEVVTRRDAEAAFSSLAQCVKPGGTILVFGHTPVLIPASYLAQTLKLRWVSSVAARPGHAELFQFYRLMTPTS
ncbi:trans-aconitate 2-methyltransferase [Pseudomonas sp. ANT_H12B]|uniref:class I SAM-dependent methyltransferase n=1 Tax=Pseudomonas sp. ANT_H12B TaxID=2597348 RepID=UPI0011ED2FBB|nr:class I SAM-dependent methyltransferase [Pseudomonas sp. ANT_H12B]KAA0972897.1 methyltransferase domain-containing protein [Pseudomonas sp. ANT_H12B]